ncbi:hypothetical protein B0J17DRAFT_722737 [Rhizoctonia solani]|nr:hypothetical protein B0J17DRAFT_722737 [Rhizoctonia solani]
MSTSNYSPCAAIKRWEEAGSSLVTTFKNYMDMSLCLELESLREGVKAEDLASKIDLTLGTISTTPFRLPEDIVSNILLNIVFGRTKREMSKPPSVESDVLAIYHRLHTLLVVCFTYANGQRDVVVGDTNNSAPVGQYAIPLPTHDTKRWAPSRSKHYVV